MLARLATPLEAALVCCALCGCTAAKPHVKPLVEVDAIFDVPREYRVLTSLPCAEGAGLVYLFSSSGALYSFDPDSLKTRRIGDLDCSARGQPFSMAVDRAGVAWLNFKGGALFHASIRDAKCKPVARYEPRQRGFVNFGMAFTSTGPDLSEETLFVWTGRPWWRPTVAGAGPGLASIDQKTLVTMPLGHDGPANSVRRGELTGTGDGRLFAFIDTRPPRLAELEQTNGHVKSQRLLPSLDIGIGAFAFSFWGGDFFFYTSTGYGTNSRVHKLSTRAGTVTQVVDDIGFTIVGAGVSTCAPTGAKRGRTVETVD